MKRYLFLLLTLLVMCFGGCAEKEDPFPITADGSIPAGMAMFPEANYLVLGSIDPAEIFKSRLGNYITSRYPMLPLAAVGVGVNLKEDIQEISFGMEFDSRAFPNFYKTYHFIIYSDLKLKKRILESLLKDVDPVEEDVMGETLYSVVPRGNPLGENNALFMVSNEEDGVLFSNNRELIIKAVAVWKGEEASLAKANKIYPLLENMDKGAPIWFVSRQSKTARNLHQQFIPPYDECYVKIGVKNRADLLCVMNFAEAEEARRTVKGFSMALKNMDMMESAFDEMSEEETTAIGVTMKFMRTISAIQEKNLAIFSASIGKEILTSQLPKEQEVEKLNEEM